MARQDAEDRITIPDALKLLEISKSAFDRWIRQAGLRNQLDKQRFPDDMRQRYLTRAQFDQVAAAHRRQIATATEIDPLERLEAVDAALLERIEALEARVAALEGKSGEPNLPL